MNLLELLEQSRDAILEQALEATTRSHLPSYERAGEEGTRDRLARLLDRAIEAIRTRRLDPMRDYGHELARERFGTGFHLLEVQSAINALEEAVWRAVVRELPAEAAPEALGLVATAMGAAKDAAACTYVNLATHARTPCRDLQSLFRVTDDPDLGHH